MDTNIRKSTWRLLAAGFFAIMLTACGSMPALLPSEAQDSITALQQLAAGVNIQSEAWRQQVSDTVEKLTNEGHTLIASDLNAVVQGAVQAAANETRCTVDFFRDRVRQDIERFIAMLRGQTPPAPVPQFCTADFGTINLNTPPNRFLPIRISGYDLQDRQTHQSRLRMVSVAQDGRRRNVSEWLAVTTPYSAVIEIGQADGCRLIRENIQSLKITYEGRDVVPFPVTLPANILTPSLVTVAAPATFYPPKAPNSGGDNDFWTGWRVSWSCVVKASVKVTARVVGNTIVATIGMRAEEWNRDENKADGDKTHAEGTSEDIVLYTAPAGKTITRLLSPASDASATLFLEKTPKTAPGGGGLVNFYKIWADGDGDDIGTTCRVEVTFNALQVELRSRNPWCP